MGKRQFLGRYWAVVLVLGGLEGCAQRDPAPPAAAPSPPPKVSRAEAEDFANALAKAIQDGDQGAANDLVDWPGICDQATDSLGMPAQPRAQFKTGALDSVQSEAGFAGTIIAQVKAGGAFRLLRVREREGYTTAVFRLSSDAGINYHEYMLANKGGKIYAADVFIYLTGEKATTSMRRYAMQVAQHLSRNFLQRLTSTESEFVKHVDKLNELSSAVREQRADDALRVYAALPASVQSDKSVLILRHQAANQIGGDPLIAAIEDFRRHHPDDVCLDFLLIDYHTLRDEHGQALGCIDRLDEAVGGDPFLNTLRAEITYRSGEVTKAFELAEKVIDADPESEESYWTLLGLTVLDKDHARMRDVLQRIEMKFGIDFSGIHDDPNYAEFRESPEGQEWLAKHPK